MRGKGLIDLYLGGIVRITPAYAGKRSLVSLVAPSIPGSPPPMRGKVTVSDRKDHVFRITPAYAGKR